MKLPGSMVENDKGNKITMQTKWIGGIQQKEWFIDPAFAPYHNPDSVRFPFWLQPEKKYTGVAWYQKEIVVPTDWKNKTISLKLERCHWETTVWLNDIIVGTQNSLSTPQTYDLPSLSTGKHLLTIRVDNRVKDIDVGENSHSISDHTQSNWNGIVGEISLNKKEKVFVNNLILKPDIKNKSVRITADIYNELENNKKISLVISAEDITNKSSSSIAIKKQFELQKGSNEIDIEYSLGKDAKLWDEFNPNLYKLNVALTFDEIETKYSETFGLREINIDDNQIKLNGRRIFLRGTLECSIFPKTGYPSTDIKEWERIYKVIKS
ncbi:MAG: beta-galactosidase, partial [Ignavibacteriae bacterium]|nr:beta-galactosidase [Ignavibacteriota bacterium]